MTAGGGARDDTRARWEVRYGPDGLVPGVVQDVADGRVLMVGYLDAEALAATLSTGEVHFHSRSRGRLWRKGETSGHALRLHDLSIDCDADALLLTVEPHGPTCHTGARSCFDRPRRVVGPEPGTASLPGHTGAAVPPERAHRPVATPRPAGAHAAAERQSSSPSGARDALPIPERSRSQDFLWLEELWATIAVRATERPAGSYTASLVAAGVDGPARKLGEESVEVLLAARDDAEAEARGDGREPTRAALAGEVADLLYHALVLLAERGLEPAEVIAVLRSRAGD